jgi:hypothetical protein
MEELICKKCLKKFNTCGEFNIHDCPADLPPKVLLGDWRHNNGYVCCGSMRIFKTDIDTNPSDAFTNELLDWVVSRLNRT